jgi:hypothetical protein
MLLLLLLLMMMNGGECYVFRVRNSHASIY